MLLSSLGTSIANVSLPTLARVFDASFQQVQWVLLAYLVAITALIVSAGRLGDLLGRRRMLSAGILLFTLASAACGFAPTLGLLTVGRAVQGVGAAAMMALTMAFVGDALPKAQTGRALGLLGTMSAVGTALGPSLGGALIAAAGWRSLFLVNVPLGLAAFFLTRRYLPGAGNPARSDRERFDGVGTLLLAVALGAYACAMTVGRGHLGSLNLTWLALAAIAAGGFVFAEAKAASPLVRFAAFRDPGLRAGLLTSGLVSTVMMTTLVVGPFYLSLGLGLTPAVVGLVLSLGPVVAAVTAAPAGKLVDRVGAARVTVIGLVGIATGCAVLALLPAALGVVGYVLPIVIVTSSYALFQTANNTAVLRDAAADRRGAISGLLNLSRNLGLVTGASVMGAVFAYGAGTTDLTTAAPAAVALGMKVTFAAAALLVGVAFAIARRGQAPKATAEPILG